MESTGIPAVAGPSHLPERPETTEVAKNKPEEKRRRRPKRKHVPSQATGTEDGEAGSSVSGTTPEVYTTPWVAKLGTTAYESKEQRLHDEIVAFYEYVLPTPDERHARAMVIAQVAEVVKRRLPKASVDPFGSVAQDLYLPDGDTDLVITTPHNYDDETKRRVLFQLAALMRNARVTDRVQVVPRARVPLISFTTMPDLGSLKLDISMNAADGLRAVPILRNYFERLPALRYLVLVLKGLLTRHGLNTAASSGLSSYGLILLAISFLQLNPMKRPAEYIEQPLVSESLGVLLMDFLEYYADIFPYATSYVSVTQGKLLPKEDKGWANAAYPEGLCIECLLNPENDVGRPTSKIRTIRALFREAHNSLKSYPFEPNSPLPYNVLGTILAISDSTLAHRALLKDVVTSGKLGRALEEVERSGPPPGGPSRRPPPSTAQQPYPPRRYPGSGPGSASSSTRPPRGGPHTQRPPSNAGLPARPSLHPSLPARPDSSRGGRGGDAGRAPGGRLIDRLSDPRERPGEQNRRR